jgi:outer membrane protein
MNRSMLGQGIFTIVLCGITAFGVTMNNQRNNKKIAVVDAIKLFNSYKMKMELEAKSAGTLKFLGHRADSIKQQLMTQSKIKDFPKTELDKMYTEFTKAQGLLEQEYQQSNQSINEQVWKRLNPLIDDYGKKEGYRLIIGANGMGSVLYNDDYYDRTKEVIDFVNKKYEEGN